MDNSKKEILFIVNPISGDIKKANIPAAIEQYLDKEKYNYSIVNTERAGHATHLAKEAVENKIDVVVAVGGDGSINEVSQALVHSNTVLGVIPLGSGNGLASHLELPIRNVRKAIEVINTGKVIKVDTGKSSIGTFVSCAGEGLDAAVARRYRHRGKRGFFSYFIATLLETLHYFVPGKVTFETDEGSTIMEVLLFSVFNSRFFGYNVSLHPETSIADGYFDVVVVPKLPFFKLLYTVILGLLGKIKKAKAARVFRTKKIVVKQEGKRAVQLDGDSFMTSANFEMEIDALSLQVLVPSTLENW